MRQENDIIISRPIYGRVNLTYVIYSFGVSLVLFVVLHNGFGVAFIPSLIFGVVSFYLLCSVSLKAVYVFPKKITIRSFLFPYINKRVIDVSNYKKVIFQDIAPGIPKNIIIYLFNEQSEESCYILEISDRQFRSKQREKIIKLFSKLGAGIEIRD